jgi:prefoldin beta subunit
MSEEGLPPWLREQLARYEQLQQSLQAIVSQKQVLEAEMSETERAVEELRKAPSEATVYKRAGSVLVKANRDELLKELEEKKDLTNTRIMVLAKQEERIRANLQEVQDKVNESLKGKQQPPAS